MAIIHNKDKRSGITYVYESKSYWDKEKGQSRATRRLIGKLDPETGEIVPTDGRCRRRSPDYDPTKDPKASDKPRTLKEYQVAYERLEEENKQLKIQLKELMARQS